MTRLILTRHGHVDWIAPERFRGRAELPLSPLGERQAQALGTRIARGWKPDAIYTSPLSRCIDTGHAVAMATGTTARVVPELADTDYGKWQGLTLDEVRQRWPTELRSWFETPDAAEIPGGETLRAVQDRTASAVEAIVRRHPDQTVVVVGHDSTNRALLLHALAIPLARYWLIKQDPCCINELEIDGTGVFTLYRANESYYLTDIA